MNKALVVLSKVPWRKVTKTVGVVALGAASVLGAMETDDNTQKAVKKIAAKMTKKEVESN